jgi:hypothetical protein
MTYLAKYKIANAINWVEIPVSNLERAKVFLFSGHHEFLMAIYMC